ncbi:hypothetical protein MKJ01_09960 [Chryseobacterium sp. SSA4.19]|nr:hypothetical protein [Chryseobacterium sp. SSA4.19]
MYREDYSAKNFNRPAWRELFSEIKKKSLIEYENNNISQHFHLFFMVFS